MRLDKTGGADTSKFKMKPKPGSPPGIELDGHARVIPLAERTDEDRQAALAAGEKDPSIKDPEGEAEHPATMPKSRQGQGAAKAAHKDRAGQQGGQHK